MKATFLTSVVALVFAVSVSAENGKTYSNVETIEAGVKKEYTTFESDFSKPISKTTYLYDANGQIQEKTSSKWDAKKGWIESEKYTYTISESGLVAELAYTKWDSKKEAWSDASEIFVYNYGANNEVVSMNEMQ